MRKNSLASGKYTVPTDDGILHARRINFGQAEVYFEVGGRAFLRHRIETSKLVAAAGLFCTPEAFKEFMVDLHLQIGSEAFFTSRHMDEAAAFLKIPQP